MPHHRVITAVLTAAGLLLAGPAGAQQGQDWFVPNQQRPAGASRPAQRPAQPPAPRAAAPIPSLTPEQEVPEAVDTEPPQQQVQMQLPPAPDVPDVPRGALPPAAVIGVLSVPDVLRLSAAYQAADKELSARRQKLNEDAQKEQVALRDLGQQLANQRASLTPEQIRNKEKELQDRITESRRKFTDRNRIIQEAGQYALAQIERTLREVVQKVAGSRGMNLVLQRAQVALNIPEFDLTPEVVDVLNKVLTSVSIPPEGVSPVALEQPAQPPATSAPAPAATPAKAPAPAQPATAQHR